ncbi:MAG: SprB repeat-containing protein, partial [Flavobacteriales bacterium]
MSVSVDVQNQVCTTTMGSCTAQVSGGVPPYTYAWSTGETTDGIGGLVPGTYTVTVTDDVGTQAIANGTVYYTDRSQDAMNGVVQGWPSAAYCPGEGRDYPYFRWTPHFGSIPGPYLFNGQPPLPEMYVDPLNPDMEWYYVPVFTPAGQIVPPGQVAQMDFTDGNGCPGSFTVISGYPVEWPVISVLDVEGACAGGTLGRIRVAYSEEGHHYLIGTEVRNMQDEVVIPFQNEWHGESATTEVFTGLAPGDYRLIQRTSMNAYSMAYDWCSDEITVTVPDLGTNCGSVIGTVYMDHDQNCIPALPNVEPRVPDGLLEFTPGPYYTTTAADGVYGVDLPNGTYTIQQIAAQIGEHCLPQPITVTVNSNVQTVNFADTALVPVDAMVALTSGAARP